MTEYQKLARAKFRWGSISGDGPHALVSKCRTPWMIRLYKSDEMAEKREGEACQAGTLCKGCSQHFRVNLDRQPAQSGPVSAGFRRMVADPRT
ncbi:MAG: hypothetical protein WAN10_13230 [Candidatus Acidiferrales bacterium]